MFVIGKYENEKSILFCVVVNELNSFSVVLVCCSGCGQMFPGLAAGY